MQVSSTKETYSGKTIRINDNESYSCAYDEKWAEFEGANLSTAKGTGSIVSTARDLNAILKACFKEMCFQQKTYFNENH